MKKLLKFTFLVASTICFLTISSCKKEAPQPVACVSTLDDFVMVGDPVTIRNCSSNGSKFIWDNGKGNTTTSTSATSVTFNYNSPGTYIVSMKAISEDGSKEDIAYQTITVVQATGDVSFWQSGTPVYDITDVVLNTGSTRQITKDYASGITTCDNEGCANFTLPVGSYSYSASDGTYTWSGTFSITKRGCLRFQLQ